MMKPTGTNRIFATNILQMKPYTISGVFWNSSNPGLSPWISSAPRNIADTALPGIPSVRRGTNDPPTTALFEVSEAITPSIAPFPQDSFSFEALLA